VSRVQVGLVSAVCGRVVRSKNGNQTGHRCRKSHRLQDGVDHLVPQVSEFPRPVCQHGRSRALLAPDDEAKHNGQVSQASEVSLGYSKSIAFLAEVNRLTSLFS